MAERVEGEYGAEQIQPVTNETYDRLEKWLEDKKLAKNEYYLIVGRFVPENNYETVIREFMASSTTKKLALISNVEQNKYYEQLRVNTGFESDERIAFVGTVYDAELLQAIRQNAYGYIHGHEVGGTNPSLLEALASTNLNLLLDVAFNREVGEDAAVYWKKDGGSLATLLEQVDNMEKDVIVNLGQAAKERILQNYSWDMIVNKYEDLFVR